MHSSNGLFSIVVRPLSARRTADLWRLDTSKDYVNGEETLGNWQPRGISIVKDYITARRKQRQLEEIEAVKATHGLRRLNLISMTRDINADAEPNKLSTTTAQQQRLLRKFSELWKKPASDMSNPIFDSEKTPQSQPQQSRRTTSVTVDRPRYTATVTHHSKNPISQKSSYLLMPSEMHEPNSTTSMQWKRRFVDLRPPYLHVHSVPDGNAINAINLSHARVDHDPDFQRLLGGATTATQQPSSSSSPTRTPLSKSKRGGHKRTGSDLTQGLAHVFAVYGEQNTFLFAARNETVKGEWIWAIDQAFSREEESQGSGGQERGDAER